MVFDSASVEKKGTSLHRFAVFTSISTFCLIIAGGLVTSTDSGLAVPDWPLSYGQLMPPMVGGIFYEHGHRMVATFVGLLTTILALWLWQVEKRKWVRNLGFIALATVIIQGVLGGLTVLLLLPTAISVSHAALAQSFFCITIVLAMVTSPSWSAQHAMELEFAWKTRKLALIATAAIFFQLILGALMRHTKSGLAIPDFPLAYGDIVPPFSGEDLPAINQERVYYDLAPVDLHHIWIHFAHRVGAVFVAIVVSVYCKHLLKAYKGDPRMREPAIILLLLLVGQIVLGALTVWTGRNIEVATAHVATGALLLGVSVLSCVKAFHLFTSPMQLPSDALVPKGTMA